MLVTAETEAAWMGLVAHRFTQIWKFFYLLNLLNLRETLAARLCFGTQIAARVALALRAPVSVRHQWASPQHSSSKLVLCILYTDLEG